MSIPISLLPPFPLRIMPACLICIACFGQQVKARQRRELLFWPLEDVVQLGIHKVWDRHPGPLQDAHTQLKDDCKACAHESRGLLRLHKQDLLCSKTCTAHCAGHQCVMQQRCNFHVNTTKTMMLCLDTRSANMHKATGNSHMTCSPCPRFWQNRCQMNLISVCLRTLLSLPTGALTRW